MDESWKPLSKRVRPARFAEIVSVRGPLLTFRRNGTLWVLRAGTDPRAWLMKLDADGKGDGRWIHARPWFDDVLRPPEIVLRGGKGLITKLRAELKHIRRLALHPYAEPTPDGLSAAKPEIMDFARVPNLLQRWPELKELLQEWAQRSLTRPRHARLAYARIRRVELRLLRAQEMVGWLGYFPHEALEFLERHGFRERRWHLLNLWLRVPEGRELFDEIPALAWMLASSWLFRTPVSHSFRSLRSLVRKPRNRILEWLDLPPGDGTLKLLRMLPGRACEMLEMIHYHAGFGNKIARGWLLNLGVPLTRQILRAAVPGLVTYPILHAIAHRQRMATFGARDWVARVYFDVRSMMTSMVGDIDQTRLGRIRSFQRLWEYHEELVALSNAHRTYLSPAPLTWLGCLPSPFSPPDWMLPLETLEAVQAEARELRHCLSGYVHEIAEGRYYAYAVHHEQGRATLGLRQRATGGWRIDQLRGLSNRSVAQPVAAAVVEWAQQRRIEAGREIDMPLLLGGAAHGLPDVLEAHGQLLHRINDEDDIPF